LILGAAYCWGLTETGQVGDGTLIDGHVPRRWRSR